MRRAWWHRAVLRGPVLALLWTWALAVRAEAHNPDTSYAQFVSEGAVVRTRLTYDLVTLRRMVELDDDRDRQVSREELTRHAPEIVAFLREHVAFESAGHEPGLGDFLEFRWPQDAGPTIPEKDYHSALALVAFRFERTFDDEPEDVVVDFRFFDRVGERHSVLGSFVRGAEVTEVIFSRFEPDYEYVTGHETPLRLRLWRFFRMGVVHIFIGYDHLCFLAALVLVAGLRDLVKVVTSFTVAHSCTLALATLGVVTLPVRVVEASIAASIVYVAWENLNPRALPGRWRLTFVFGLVHGFGFAEILRGMSLPEEGLFRCLLTFNFGVEFGQLAIVAALYWPLARLREKDPERRHVRIASFCILGLGSAWFFDRVLGLGWMPF